jgi:hypothetical protein
MNIEDTPHIWSSQALLSKAQRYAELMHKQDHEDWQFGFWSALVLELLSRSALAFISPVLLADSKDWNNLLYALGNNPTAARYQPRSIDIGEVYSRLERILPEFTQEMLNFCLMHTTRRNSELHTGDLAFENISNSKWLPMHYATCKVLLNSMGEQLEVLLGDVEAPAAEELIQATNDEAAKAIKKIINAHAEVWKTKTDDERNQLSEEAFIWASRRFGHRVICPACGVNSLVNGEAITPPVRTLTDGISVQERRTMLPSRFECRACELKIEGYSRLQVAGLGDTYSETSTFQMSDYYDLLVEHEFDVDAYFDYNE